MKRVCIHAPQKDRILSVEISQLRYLGWDIGNRRIDRLGIKSAAHVRFAHYHVCASIYCSAGCIHLNPNGIRDFVRCRCNTSVQIFLKAFPIPPKQAKKATSRCIQMWWTPYVSFYCTSRTVRMQVLMWCDLCMHAYIHHLKLEVHVQRASNWYWRVSEGFTNP